MKKLSKTDTAIKRMLDAIGDQGNLRRRRFLGTSRLDQELWSNGGLSFGLNGFVYGSCDFAWFVNEQWIDPYNQARCNEKPYLVIEGTDCLNTRSWGSAQVQRFHHALGPFLCGINSVYFLNRGTFPIRPYLPASAYFASLHGHQKGNRASYLVTDDINDIRDLVMIMSISGTESRDLESKAGEILKRMISYFDETFRNTSFNSNWEEYLKTRAITKTPQGTWVKDLGPKKASLIDSSVRYGHIVLGEALTTEYLLIGSGMLNPETQIFYYLFPLMDRNDIAELDTILEDDKEWNLVRKAGHPWRIITLDDLEGIDENIRRQINQNFKHANLNQCKNEWEAVKESIRHGLRTGQIIINDVASPSPKRIVSLKDFFR